MPGDAQEQWLLVVPGTGGTRRPHEERGLCTLLQPQGRLEVVIRDHLNSSYIISSYVIIQYASTSCSIM